MSFQGTLGVVEPWRLAKKSRQSNLKITKIDIEVVILGNHVKATPPKVFSVQVARNRNS